MENIKTLGELLQEVVENEDKRYSLHEFLLESTEEERKEIQSKLVDADCKQFYEFMDGYTFVNEDEVNAAVVEYFEAVNNRGICIGEMLDLWDVAEDYMREKWLNFDED